MTDTDSALQHQKTSDLLLVRTLPRKIFEGITSAHRPLAEIIK